MKSKQNMSEIEYDEATPMEVQLDVMGLFKKTLKSWRTILIWALAFGIVGLIIGFSTPKKYTVTSKLAPELSQKASNSLSSLANLAGVNLNNITTSSDAMRPDLYPDVISSVPFIVDLFDMPVSIEKRKETINTTLYDYMLNYQRRPWWGYVTGFPMMAMGWIMGLLKPEEEEPEYTAGIPVDSFQLTKNQSAVVKAISKSIIASVDKKTYVLTLNVQMQDKVVAGELSRAVIDNLKKYVTRYRTEKSRKDEEYYQKLFDEAKAGYLMAQTAYARYVDAHQGVVLKSVLVKQQELQNEVNLSYQTYTTCNQQLQTAKAKVQQETPVLAELQPPTVPMKGTPSKVSLFVEFFILGALLAVLWVCFVKDWLIELKK